MEQTLRRLGRDDKDLRPADLQPLARLQRREIMAELHHRAAVVGLRQHDAVRRPRHHPREVVQGERRAERIDAHPELMARAVGLRLQVLADTAARPIGSDSWWERVCKYV